MSDLESIVNTLVEANRILGHEGILDAFGHVSARHPEDSQRFLLARARSPEVIEASDILEFHLDGTPVVPDGPIPYVERFIHGSIYEVRSDVNAVCHNHTLSILPFGISKSVALQAVIHTGRFLGAGVPVWDIADEFGTETDLLVRNIEHGRSLGRAIGSRCVVLMRGHGSVVVADSAPQLVGMCISMDRNAQVLLQASQLGEFQSLHEGESRPNVLPGRLSKDNRSWEYFRARAGIE